jgi:glucose-1-phosphate thymidylyltransferase
VLTARPFLGDSPFVMYLGDNLLQGGITDLVHAFESGSADALILLTEVDDPQSYGIAALDADGRVKQLVEKPTDPPSNLALVGVYLFTADIHVAAEAIEPSPRGELEITDAIQWLVDNGRTIEPHVVAGWWKDTGRLADMLEANRLILDVIEPSIIGDVQNSTVEGRVIIEAGATLRNTTVRGPAAIAAGAVLTDAYIGPYTAVGAGCEITASEVENSILLAGSKVLHLDARMESSLLGRNATIDRSPRQPRAYRFMIGDNSDVGIL